MRNSVSQNTKAILLLTGPLQAEGKPSSPPPLTPGEYNRLARQLHSVGKEPADLLSSDGTELVASCAQTIDSKRVLELLGRGLALSQALDHWQSRAIWVVSRADARYPSRLRARLRERAPSVLYGCGEIGLLEVGGLAVVGSRDVSAELIQYTKNVAELAARADKMVVSGGAKGVDKAAMRGALEAGGRVCGILSDNLLRAAMARDQRDALMEKRLTLVSATDPTARFNVGNAMQRNKLIYALADAALIVSSDVGKGGTWTGAVEQLDKLRLVPVYVRSTGDPAPGLSALEDKGALPWPNPKHPEALTEVLNRTPPPTVPLVFEGSTSDPPAAAHIEVEQTARSPLADDFNSMDPTSTATSAAERLYRAAREAIEEVLAYPMSASEVAASLEVTVTQARDWLQRLVSEGVLERSKSPATYFRRQDRLFG